MREIERMMREERDAYFRDEAVQQEYRDLVTRRARRPKKQGFRRYG